VTILTRRADVRLESLTYRSGIEHLGDVGVVHQGQGLAFGLETGDDLAAVDAGFDELEGHFALDASPPPVFAARRRPMAAVALRPGGRLVRSPTELG